ncbi:MAG: WD40 repeat domain-containing protein [Anaerolineaceae bacterium]|nr:WD40 repeat domain-containing protein [Anaerolineaceae bacterium]
MRTTSIPRLIIFALAMLLTLSLAAAQPAPAPDPEFALGGGLPLDAAWSPDGSRFAVVSSAGLVFYRQSGGELAHWKTVYLTLHPRRGVFSPDGETFYLGTEEGRVLQLSIDSGEILDDWLAHRLPITAIAVDPSGKHLAAAGWRADTRVWSLEDRTQIAALDPGSLGARELQFVDANSLLTFSGAQTLYRWDVNTQKITQAVSTTTLSAVGFTADGSVLAGVHGLELARYRADNGHRLPLISLSEKASALAVSADGARAAVLGDSGAAVYDLQTGEQTGALTFGDDFGAFRLIRFAPDGEALDLVGHQVLRWQLSRLGPVAVFPLSGRVDAYTISTDGSILASRVQNLMEVEIWRADETRPALVLADHLIPVQDAVFLPAGTDLLTSADALRLWDASGGALKGEWRAPSSEAQSMWVYDPEDQETRLVQLGEQRPLGRIAVSRDGHLVAVESLDGQVWLFDLSQSGSEPLKQIDLGLPARGGRLTSQVQRMIFDEISSQLFVQFIDDRWQWLDLETGLLKQEGLFPQSETASAVCFAKLDGAASALRFADARVLYTLDLESGALSQTEGSLCGYHGADLAFEGGSLRLRGAALALVDLSQKDHTAAIYDPSGQWLAVQRGRYADFSVHLNQMPDALRAADILRAVDGPLYNLDYTAAIHFNSDAQRWTRLERNGTLLVEDAESAARIRRVSTATITAAAFSTDGRQLVFAEDSGGIQHWSRSDDWIHTQTLLEAASSRVQAVRAVAVSADGAWMAGGNERGDFYLWDASGALRGLRPGAEAVQAAAFSPDGAWLMARGRSGVDVWRMDALDLSAENGAVLGDPALHFDAYFFQFTPDSGMGLVGRQNSFRHPLELWSLEEASLIGQWNQHAQISAFSAETRWVSSEDQLVFCAADGGCAAADSALRLRNTPLLFDGDTLLYQYRNDGVLLGYLWGEINPE